MYPKADRGLFSSSSEILDEKTKLNRPSLMISTRSGIVDLFIKLDDNRSLTDQKEVS